jgi:hypothetical protein
MMNFFLNNSKTWAWNLEAYYESYEAMEIDYIPFVEP